VIKHVPGHGRAPVDSHHACPLVETSYQELANTDFAPFRALAAMPWAMTAHIVYSAIDPSAPATLSSRVLAEVVRGEIGFDGVLVSDDLSMRALGGALGDRTRLALAAGCDLALHCNGDPGEMEEVVKAARPTAARHGVGRFGGARHQRAARHCFVAVILRGRFDAAEPGRMAGGKPGAFDTDQCGPVRIQHAPFAAVGRRKGCGRAIAGC